MINSDSISVDKKALAGDLGGAFLSTYPVDPLTLSDISAAIATQNKKGRAKS